MVWMLCVILLMLFIGLYRNYMDGTMELDQSLYNEANYQKIIENWDKLSETGLLQTSDMPYILWYFTRTSGNRTKELVMLRYFPDGEGEKYTGTESHGILIDPIYIFPNWTFPDGELEKFYGTAGQGIYHRVGLIDAIMTPAVFMNCTTMFQAGNSDLIIHAIFYDTDGTSEPLDSLFRSILDTI